MIVDFPGVLSGQVLIGLLGLIAILLTTAMVTSRLRPAGWTEIVHRLGPMTVSVRPAHVPLQWPRGNSGAAAMISRAPPIAPPHASKPAPSCRPHDARSPH